MIKILVTTVTCVILLSGCQSPLATKNEASRSSLGLLCERYVGFPPSNNFHIYAKKELERRGVDVDKCLSMDK